MATRKRVASKQAMLSPKEIAESLRKYDGEYLACREHHRWSLLGLFYDGEGNIRRQYKCDRCDTFRIDCLSLTGERIKSARYKHPDGYRIGRVQKIEVRAEFLRRSKIYASEARMVTQVTKQNGKRYVFAVKHNKKTKVSA